jgi:predicted aspartyl protease
MTVDTGACVSIIPQTVADDLKITPVGESQNVNTMNGRGAVSDVMLEKIGLGSLALTYTRIYCTAGMKGLDRTLGMDVLSRYRMLIDGPNKLLYLKRYDLPDRVN